MQTNLDQLVLQQLKARKGDWPSIVLSSSVSYSWLSKFVNGHIPNPGYATLKRLHAVLEPEQPQAPAHPAQAATETVAAAGGLI